MKTVHLTTLVACVLLSGCASTVPHNDVASTSEERAAPLGTLFAKKGAGANDPAAKANMQSLENDRTMNNNGLSIRQQ